MYQTKWISEQRLLPGIKKIISNDKGVSSSGEHHTPKRIWSVGFQQGCRGKLVEKEESTQQRELDQLGTGRPNKQINVDPYLVPYTKVYSKCKTIKLPEDNIGENLCGLRLGKYFFDTMLKP